MKKSTENLDAQIQTLEAEIDVLQQRWRRYPRVMPGRPRQPTPAGPYDPRLFLEKSALSITIDEKQIALAGLRKQRAEQELAAYRDAGHLAQAEDAFRDAESAHAEAARALEAAGRAYTDAQDQLQRQQERHTRLTTAVVQHEAEGKRWTSELERDQRLQEYASGGPGRAA